MMTNVVGCEPEDGNRGDAGNRALEPLSDGRQLPFFAPSRGGTVVNGICKGRVVG